MATTQAAPTAPPRVAWPTLPGLRPPPAPPAGGAVPARRLADVSGPPAAAGAARRRRDAGCRRGTGAAGAAPDALRSAGPGPAHRQAHPPPGERGPAEWE